MSRPGADVQDYSAVEGQVLSIGVRPPQTTDSVLCALIEHARPTAKDISEVASDRSGFGVSCLLLNFIKTGRSRLALERLDLSGFSLSAGKLKFLLSSLPSGPGVMETIRCECDFGEPAVVIFHQLSGSLEHLDLSGNSFRSVSMEGLGSVLLFSWLPSLLSLDLSDNPLGPSGVRAFAKGLSASPYSLLLQSLKLARTRAKTEGVRTLAEALKAKKTTSLQMLDLEGNDMRPAGLKYLASAVNAEALSICSRFPKLRRLDLGRGFMDSTQLAAFATALGEKGAPSLQELVLPEGGVESNSVGVVGFANTISSGHFSELRRLKMCSRHDMILETFTTLGRSLATGKASLLQSLDLEIVRFNVGGEVWAIAEAISGRGLCALTSFRLSVAGVKGSEISVLGLALGEGGCSALQKLDLCWMENGDEGVAGLAEGLGGGVFVVSSGSVPQSKMSTVVCRGMEGRGMHSSGRGLEHR
uniref:Uncharacterized protein n=1 Tax=Chromera velia CCMP2878 TaxID=1169474 RepID=A0A0G4GQ11_9ALVE|eukprot:Cvel_22884.t1-p1 / transcript=Cvel_22884.t1 / gene=Cvel_22884 / organism=Chromera_velia_CCMP2878 / gene_product=hypothetical protein / transcript_product=hypothetical protein / location=Cvel_scaffold2298:20805-24831(-) / protein_length=472 / sequence_SO=supercontig / SO=protein_coding / is_pseudo=false